MATVTDPRCPNCGSTSNWLPAETLCLSCDYEICVGQDIDNQRDWRFDAAQAPTDVFGRSDQTPSWF